MPRAAPCIDYSFTGMNSDTSSGLYDFLYREYSTQGRWPQPDPAGLAAIDVSNPQSWNRYAYAYNSPCSQTDPLGLDTCSFTIRVKNKAKLTSDQLTAIEGRINDVLGSALADGNSVQANFSSSGKSDFTLNVSPGTKGGYDGWSGWPNSSPTIWWGNVSGYPDALTYAGTLSAHEIVHRGAGPVLDLSEPYNGIPNLMNVNQAQSAGLTGQVIADWANPSSASGFASLSPGQVQKLYSKCSKAHPRPTGARGPSGIAQGDLFWNSMSNFWLDTLPQTTSITATVGGQPVQFSPF